MDCFGLRRNDVESAGGRSLATRRQLLRHGIAGAVCAISRFSSGMQEPQLVPAFSLAPISAAERAPAAIASQMVVRPTPKQAQTIGPALARPSVDLPDSSMRR